MCNVCHVCQEEYGFFVTTIFTQIVCVCLLLVEPQALSSLVLNFPERNAGSYARAHLHHPIELHAFTACMHVRPHRSAIHTVLSYFSAGNDNELMITVGYEVGLWIGNEFINLPHDFQSEDWVNYCITWSSNKGATELWINGLVGEEQHFLRGGYSVSPRGVFILGKDQDGVRGITDSDAFVGRMTDVNVWDYVLSTAEVREQLSCERNATVTGNFFSWGSTLLSLYGGVQLDNDVRCKKKWTRHHCLAAVPPMSLDASHCFYIENISLWWMWIELIIKVQ